MKSLVVIGAIMIGSFFISCSDSTPPTTNYALILHADTEARVGLNVEVFSLRVMKNGQPLKGATLKQTDYPSYAIFNRQGTSDSTGRFPEFDIIFTDTLTEVAFQAVMDTLTSNNIIAP